MKALILALATALPQFSEKQENIGKKVIEALSLTGKIAQTVESVYNRSAISRRYSVLEDIQLPIPELKFWSEDFLSNVPGTEARNEIYKEEAPKLAVEAARKAIEKWSGNSQDITHVIAVSCTGVMAPGLEFIIQQELNLPPNTQRFGLNFMGCFGAFRALALADSIARVDKNNRVLVVCVELCSLHFQIDDRPEVFIGNALFSDGAAATIVGAQARDFEKPLWAIDKFNAYAIKDTRDKMTWSASDTGFVMTLSRDIPKLLEKNAQAGLEPLLNVKAYPEYTWAVHPGGKTILANLECSLNLTKEQTQASWDVLDQYGNMSSATFLFVLDKLAQKQKLDSKVIGLGFGPGLSIEALLLNTVNS
jgi:predicted naringenin-chalcone synthase